MGAGVCSEECEAQLLREAFQLNLGFSESQLSSAIKHLVKEYGSVKDAPAWIRQDNFTVLVNYILDHADSEILKPRSEIAHSQTEHGKLLESGKPLFLSKEVAHESLLSRTASSKAIDSEVDQQKPTSVHQKRKLEKQQFHSHHIGKLLTNFVKDNQSSLDSKVNKVRNITAEIIVATQENSSGHAIANKTAKTLLDQVQQFTPSMPNFNSSPMLYAQSITDLTKKKRGKEMNESTNTAQKKGKVHKPEAVKDLLLESRTLLPSGCEDLATGHGSHQDLMSGNANLMCSKPLKDRYPSGKSQAQDEMFETESLAKQCAERKRQANGNLPSTEKACLLVNQDKREDICSNSLRVKSISTNSSIKVGAEVLSSGAEVQKTSSASNKSVLDDSQSEHFFLKTLEASLKQENCASALKILKAWKIKRKQEGSRQTEDPISQGKRYELVPEIPGRKVGFVVSYDISRGLEKVPISCVNEYNTEVLPENFLYITRSVIRQAAHVDTSLNRIGDLHCCCSDDCLRSSEACKCTDSTRGEYAYEKNGRLIERLAIGFVSGCMTINGDFITECCDKCRCNMRCGNRIVQRGITIKLQVFMTRKKGWGVRALEKIPARTFVFEYLGEIATNLEQYDRNREYRENGVYTYVMCLDADLDMEKKHFKEGLSDHEALVLDATIFGNVSRFVNHRCNDANLFMRPVQIETRDTHYYHAALFSARDIEEMEELTWDYGIDFEDDTHLLKAFKCYCKSLFCRDKARHLTQQDKERKGKLVKSSRA